MSRNFISEKLMDESERIFWDEERAKERHFVSTSPERVKLMTTALEQSRIESFYNALEQCVRTYILHTPDSLSCQTQHRVKGCVRIFSDYESEGIWECHKDTYPSDRIYSLSQRLCDALQQWNWWYNWLGDLCELGMVDGEKAHLPEEQQAYMRTGYRLACEVKRQAPECKVIFLNQYGLPGVPSSASWLEILPDEKGEGFIAAPLIGDN